MIIPSGTIIIIFTNITIERVSLKEKLRMFTTGDIIYERLRLIVQDSAFRNNSLEKGFFFEFKHNFEEASFLRSSIEGN